MCEVWGKRGADGESLGPPTVGKFLFLAAFLPLHPTPPLQPRGPRGNTAPGGGGPGQAGRCRCPLGGWGVRACMRTPSRGAGRGRVMTGKGRAPAWEVSQAGEGSQGPPMAQRGPLGTQPTPALGFPWAESERGKAFPVPGPEQTSPAPACPGSCWGTHPLQPQKAASCPSPCPSCPLLRPGVTVTDS